MENIKLFFENHKKGLSLVFLLTVMCIGAFLRVFSFGEVPCGFNQDEAFAAYESFSLLNYGMDSFGYHNPTYFVSWGSGMNVLESYLAIPFFAMFGCSATVFRLPMLICSLFCMPVFYLLLREIFDKKTSLIGLAIFCICPWHVMLSRWGLESNLAPSFLLYGFFFLVKGIKNNRFWLLSALMYGISLYSYSVTWIIVPVTLLAVFIYMFVCKYKFSFAPLFGSILILYILALPHILFMFVNMNVIPEITTDFISIPKLVVMRGSEISLSNLFVAENYYNVLHYLFGGGDSTTSNTLPEFGMYYFVSIPFIFVGIVTLVKSVVVKIKERCVDGETFLFFGFFCSLLVALLFNPININKSNHLHIYTIALIAVGIHQVIRYFVNHKKLVTSIIIGAYTLSVAYFGITYFQTFNDSISYVFRERVDECITFVKEQQFETVNVDSGIYYSQLLFYDQTPTPLLLETKKYKNYPSAFLDMESFSNYYIGVDYNALGNYSAYIIPSNNTGYFSSNGYMVENFGHFSVAYK